MAVGAKAGEITLRASDEKKRPKNNQHCKCKMPKCSKVGLKKDERWLMTALPRAGSVKREAGG